MALSAPCGFGHNYGYGDGRTLPALALNARFGIIGEGIDWSGVTSSLRASAAASVPRGCSSCCGMLQEYCTKLPSARTSWLGRDTNATSTTLFDLASLTKVTATTTAAMLLHQKGLLPK